MVWKDCTDLEREIILSIHKKPKPISRISRDIGRRMNTIGKTIERLKEQGILEKQLHSNDLRISHVSLINKRVKIKKSHKSYINYYLFISFTLILSLLISNFLNSPFYILGSLTVAIPLFFKMLFEIYFNDDKTEVFKNPKEVGKPDKKVEES